MMFRQSLRSSRTTTTQSRRRSLWGRARLWLQSLEERTTPANLVVTSSLDDGSAGTLRAVMATADTNAEADTITFQAGVTVITLATGQISMTTDVNNLTINGAGVTVNGDAIAAATNRIFNFNVAAGNPTFTITGLTLANGLLSTGSGGAIQFANDPVVLDGVALVNNKVTGTGGAIGLAAAVTGAKLTILNSTATGNSATSTGGVMNFPTATSCTVTINNSTFDSNTSTTGTVAQGVGTVTLNVTLGKFTNNTGSSTGGTITIANAGSFVSVNQSTFTNNKSTAGGAITFTAGAGLLVENSTFNGNSSTVGNSGGAIRYTVAIGAGGYNLRNCTFVNNSSVFNGGALGFSVMTGVATIQNCTFTGNSVSSTGGGGAIGVNSSGTGTISVESCIISGNMVTGTGTGPDIFFTTGTLSAKTSLIGSTVGITNFMPDATTSGLLGQDPMLGTLANNGGPTDTLLLSAGSPAINAGSNPAGLMFDQRGTGFSRTLNGTTDIGAVEVYSVIPSAKATAPNVPPANATQVVTVVYSDETGINTGGIGLGNVRLTGPGYGVPEAPSAFMITAGMNGDPMVTVEYTFAPPGGAWEYTENGTYSVEMQAGQVFDTDAVPNPVPAGPTGKFSVSIPLPPIVVDNIGDTDDGIYTANELTLREAIKLSNDAVGTQDSISFAAALNGMTISLASTLKITDPLIITGPGAANLTINGGGLVRLFEVDAAGTGSKVAFSGLTLTNGNSTTGAAIQAIDEAITIAGCVVSNNIGTSTGGAITITAAAGSLTVDDCLFDLNSSTAGGAITTQNGAGLLVTGSLFTGNSSTLGNAGGAISIWGTISAFGSKIRNSTFTGNSSPFTGGAIGFRAAFAGQTFIQNCTIVNNTAAGTGIGAGIGVIAGQTGTVVIESSIVFGNTKTGGVASDIGGPTQMTANNCMIGSAADAAVFAPNATTTALLGADPLLSGLASNGGPTQTMIPQGGSLAFNNGSNPAMLPFDQRGMGFPRELQSAPDIGAVESLNFIPSGKATSPNVPPANATQLVTVIYTDETGINTGSIGLGNIRLTGPGYGAPEAPTAFMITSGMNGDKSITVEYTFTPPGGTWEESDNGTYSIEMQASQVFDTDVTPNAVTAGPKGSFSVTFAKTFLVDNIGDIDDSNYGAGELTLREAMKLANDNVGLVDNITFAPALDGQTILIANGEIAASDAFNLTGNGVGKTIISGNLTNRIFNLGHTGKTSTIGNATFRDGLSTAAGGAIVMNSSNLTVNNCLFTNNSSATGSLGGAINLGAATLTINDSVFQANIGGTNGGGAIGTGTGTIIINRSTLSQNTVAGSGNAVWVNGAGKLTIVDSTINDNSSSGTTGGALATTTGTISITNSTISGNNSPNAAAVGGGIRVTSTGTVTIFNSTVTNNTAGGGGGGIGFSSTTATGTLNVTSSIIAKNNHGTHPDLFTSATSISLNTNFNQSILGISSDTDITVVNTGSQIGTPAMPVDPLLTPLGNYGGSTQTHALAFGSPAINKGSNPAMLAGDQRGALYARSSGGGVDIGAFEVQAPPQVTNVLVNNGAAQRSLVTSITVQFDNSIVLSAGAFVLTRTANGAAGNIGIVATPVGNSVVLTFNNTGTIALDPGGSLPDGSYELKIIANNVTGTAGTLDGNKNGISDGSTADDVSSKLHRLFGDANGDGAVTASDFNAFRLEYGVVGASIFDFDNSGSVTAADFNAFRTRYGASGYVIP